MLTCSPASLTVVHSPHLCDDSLQAGDDARHSFVLNELGPVGVRKVGWIAEEGGDNHGDGASIDLRCFVVDRRSSGYPPIPGSCPYDHEQGYDADEPGKTGSRSG